MINPILPKQVTFRDLLSYVMLPYDEKGTYIKTGNFSEFVEKGRTKQVTFERNLLKKVHQNRSLFGIR